MDETELNEMVKKISLEYFNKPFNHKARFNLRLRAIGGRYITSSHNLEFNKRAYEIYGLEELINIIKHELCHYHLHIQGKGYMHKDKAFKNLLSQVEGTRYSKELINNRKISYRYQITCKNCGIDYYRKRRININNYRCSKCFGRLQLIRLGDKNIDN